jgi:hypothetical protein
MNQPAATTTNPSRSLFTVKQFAERNPFVTESGLRFQIFNRKENGLEASGALVRIGKRVLIDENKYLYAWVDSQQELHHG